MSRFFTPKPSLAFWMPLVVAAVIWCSGCEPPQPDAPRQGEATAPAEAHPAPEAASTAAPVASSAGSSTAPAAAKEAAPSTPAESADAAAANEARRVLRAMVEAYAKATSYRDHGKLRAVVDRAQEPLDESFDFSLAWARPNRINTQIYQGHLVSNGTTLFATVEGLTEGDAPQVLRLPAPKEVGMPTLFIDPIIGEVISQGFAGLTPQLVLLFEKDPLSILLGEGTPVLDTPGEVQGHRCHRVKLHQPEGTLTLWIDEASYVLRRLTFPTDAWMQHLVAQEGPVDRVSLEADFVDAELNPQLDDSTFAFSPPDGAKFVEVLVPPQPGQTLGQPVSTFSFVSLAGAPITPADLKGRVAVLDFWASWCGPCRESLPRLNEVYEKYRDNPRVAFLAVSVDLASIPNDALEQAFREWKIALPIYRDIDQKEMPRVANTVEIPFLLVVGPDGVVQDFNTGANPDLVANLSQTIDDLLAGKNVYPAKRALYDRELERYKASAKSIQQNGASEPSMMPSGEAAPKSAPQSLKLTPAWQSDKVPAPCNLLVLPDAQGPARLAVISNLQSIVEVGLDGQIIAAHALPLAPKEMVTQLRALSEPVGGWRLAAFCPPNGQRVHLLDDQWKPLWSYPEDAMSNPHSGIADIEFGDLSGDGQTEMFVGYSGVVGVQAVRMNGQRAHSNRSVANVFRMAVGPVTRGGARQLLCTNYDGPLAVFDANLNSLGSVTVGDLRPYYIRAADLGGDGRLSWLALCEPKSAAGGAIAAGFELDGRVLWQYTLPVGQPQTFVDPVAFGRVRPGSERQWVIAGPDGSLHFLAANGTPIDHFNYGKLIQGMCLTEVNGRPLLIVATADGLEAWQVE